MSTAQHPIPPTVWQGDGLAALEALPAGSVAAVVTDPPWNLGKDYGEGVDDARSDADYARWLRRVLAAALASARDGVLLLPGACNLGTVEQLLEGIDVRWQRTLWWQPPATSIRPPHTLDVRTEPVVWMRHAPPHGAVAGAPIRIPLEEDPYLGRHPCPKPVDLFHHLIARCVQDDGTIIDPFAGTGGSLVAAARLGRRAVGYELNPAFHRLAAARVNALTRESSSASETILTRAGCGGRGATVMRC